MERKRVVIIGGGLAGLAASYDLARAGHQGVVPEARPALGGPASSFRLEGHPIERFYHFICRSDRDLLTLVDELGLGGKLHWRHTHTAFYYNSRYYPFGSPPDLLRFSAGAPAQRLP